MAHASTLLFPVSQDLISSLRARRTPTSLPFRRRHPPHHHHNSFPSLTTSVSRPILSLPLTSIPTPTLLPTCSIRAPTSAEKDGVLEELREEAEEALEWRSVCRQVAAFASTDGARAVCLEGALKVGRDREESERLLKQTAAAAALPRRIKLAGIDDMSGPVSSAAAGKVLGVRELCAVERSLRGARMVYEELLAVASGEEAAERYSSLLEIFRNCNFLSELVHQIELCIDGNLFVILDQASPRLASIRAERRRNADNLESLLKGISSKIFQAGGIDSPLATRRRSRMCVGIRASHKALLPDGIILGVSSSGATYFMEPGEAIDLNNMEVRLSNSEKNEELAILSMLTSYIARSTSDITYLMERIQELDLALARGYHALWMNGVCPVFNEAFEGEEINENQELFSVDIESMCHPLLLEHSVKKLVSLSLPESETVYSDEISRQVNDGPFSDSNAVVPLDIKIRQTKKVVVISGPNTGGKTVAMKTLGLASLMSKAGLFLPAKNGPRLPWFDNILADVGDSQSLEHNLSTFSGHMSRICKILEVSTKRSLVLIDEIGNGTDPSEGVALSISILQHLVSVVGLAVVTTHYVDLTTLKARDCRFENAAMEFCIETLQPTYRIWWGSTGNSNALNIAKAIGFDQKILGHAEVWIQKLLPDKQKERHGLLYKSLLEERDLLQSQANNAASVLSEVKKLYHEISSEAKDLDRREAALKARESRRVRHELKSIKSQLNLLVKNFESQLQNANLDQFNSLMRQAEASIASLVDAHRLPEDLSSRESSSIQYIPQIGDRVRINNLGHRTAIVVGELGDDDHVLVQYGKLKVRVKRSDMEFIQSSGKVSLRRTVQPIRAKEWRRGNKSLTMESEKDQGRQHAPAVQTSKNTIDLRGMRAEVASKYLSMAISACRSNGVLFIIHGMGIGSVKELALDILQKHPRVTKSEQESPMNYGCTVAYIK